MTHDEARQLYQQHADDLRNVDLVTAGFYLAIGLLGALLVGALALSVYSLGHLIEGLRTLWR